MHTAGSPAQVSEQMQQASNDVKGSELGWACGCLRHMDLKHGHTFTLAASYSATCGVAAGLSIIIWDRSCERDLTHVFSRFHNFFDILEV